MPLRPMARFGPKVIFIGRPSGWVGVGRLGGGRGMTKQ